jgi:predicted secreted protein
MRRSRLSTLRERLRDERGGRVLYVSHCLLNENVRYLGGARRRAAVDEVVDECRLRGLGICQMPCPEQRAWGGVLKGFIAPLYGRHQLQGVAPALYGPFRLYTQAVYARIARTVAADIADYVRSGLEVVGVVGVGASPSCGVHTTLRMDRTVRAIARCELSTLDRTRFNRDVILDNVVAGEGLFMRALRRATSRRGIELPFFEHDLMAEVSGRPIPPLGLP